MTTESCDVTVVIPTHNRGELLSRTVRCALAQIDVSLEVIVVDDGSADATGDVLSRERDPRVRSLRHERSLGAAKARNRGIAEARGDWLAFLDDDDLWAPAWLHTALEVGRATGASALYGGRWIVDEHCRVRGLAPVAPASYVRRMLPQFNAMGGPSNVVVKRAVMTEIGGFDERFSILEDWEAWLRVIAVSDIAPVPTFLIAYTEYSGNKLARDPKAGLTELQLLATVIETEHVGDGKGDGVDAASFVRSLAGWSATVGLPRQSAKLWLRSALTSRRPTDILRAILALTREPPGINLIAAPDWLAAVVAGEDRGCSDSQRV